jgi:hypothetical protein
MARTSSVSVVGVWAWQLHGAVTTLAEAAAVKAATRTSANGRPDTARKGNLRSRPLEHRDHEGHRR